MLFQMQKKRDRGVDHSPAIANNITQDPGMPKATDGKTVVEVPGQANAEIQQFIMANTKDGAGYIPGQSPYTASNAALNKPVTTNSPGDTMTTAACANGDLACKSGVGVQQNAPLTQQTKEAIADGAANVSRASGVVAAGATAVAAQTGPYAKPAETVAVGATVVGVAADAVEQIMRPDMGKVAWDSVARVVQDRLDKRLPVAAPITNELVEAWKGSGSIKDLQTWSNEVWNEYLKRQGLVK